MHPLSISFFSSFLAVEILPRTFFWACTRIADHSESPFYRASNTRISFASSPHDETEETWLEISHGCRSHALISMAKFPLRKSWAILSRLMDRSCQADQASLGSGREKNPPEKQSERYNRRYFTGKEHDRNERLLPEECKQNLSSADCCTQDMST